MAATAVWDFLRGWPLPSLAENARALLEQQDAELVDGTLRYSLSRGLLLRDVRMKLRLEAGSALLEAPLAIVGLDRWKGLHGVTWCDDLEVERAKISILLSGQVQKKPEELPDYPGDIPLRLRRPRFAPDQLRLDDAEIKVHAPGGDAILSLSGVSLTLEQPYLSTFVDNPLEALYGSGTLRAGHLTRSGITHTEVAGNVDIQGGQLNFPDLAFAGPEGSYHLTGVRLSPTSWPVLVRANLDASLEDTRYALSRLGLPVLGLLGGHLKATIKGPLTAPRVEGSLSFAVSGQMDSIPVLEEAANLLLPSKRPQRARGAWDVPFVLQDSVLTIEDARLRTDVMEFRITGTLRGGACSFDIDVLLPASEMALALPPGVLADLSAGGGLVRIPIVVTGTSAAPRFDVRKSAVRRPSTYSELRSYLRANAVANQLSGALLP